MKTKIKTKKPIQWGKVLLIEELYSSKSTIQSFTDNIKNNRPEITEDELNKEIQNLVMKDNFYNKVMDEISKSYEIEYDEEEIEEKFKFLKESHPNVSEDELKNNVKISIFKKIIYDDLAKDWEIVVTDDMAKNALENFYKNTGNPIREYLTDPNKFNDVKETILEQIITERVINAFASNFKLKQKS